VVGRSRGIRGKDVRNIGRVNQREVVVNFSEPISPYPLWPSRRRAGNIVVGISWGSYVVKRVISCSSIISIISGIII